MPLCIDSRHSNDWEHTTQYILHHNCELALSTNADWLSQIHGCFDCMHSQEFSKNASITFSHLNQVQVHGQCQLSLSIHVQQAIQLSSDLRRSTYELW